MKHLRKTLTLLLALAPFACYAQDFKSYVQKHTVPIRSVSPSDTSFDDLEALGTAIGDVRIVMLGEQDHGDAPAFLAKTRIIKYLHEKKGFNVLAFESDFFALNQGLDLLPGADSFTKKNIFPIWTFCDACADLFYTYLPGTRSTGSPLKLAGFDNQMVLPESRHKLVGSLDSFLSALQIPITTRSDYRTKILPALDSLQLYYGAGSGDIDNIRAYVGEISEQLKGKIPEDDFWMMVVRNLVAEAEQFHYFHKDWLKGSYVRDEQMAANLQWLASKKYPEEKIIVWAANGHVAKFGYDTKDGERSRVAMGYFFTIDDRWKDQTYVLGFTSREGKAGRLFWKPQYTIPQPARDGFERWIDPKLEQAYIDFSAYRTLYPGKKPSFQLKGLGHDTRFTYDWTSVFDGVFYIREMYPCKVNEALISH